ncbi:MAG: RNA polymerase sigma-70 factor [Bacteroidota bacterium]
MSIKNFDRLSDKQLLSLVRIGNEVAFSQLFERHWKKLLNTAYRVTRDKDAAQDIVQEVFADIWTKRNYLDIENLEAYLHQSTRYTVFRYIRKSKMIIKDFDFIESPVKINITEEQLDFQETSSRLEHSISQLPEQRKRVFQLSRYENMSNKQIAKHLDISVRTVESHISKALETLRYQFSDIILLVVLAYFI